ncbi:ATP-binding cassette domain-containing protein [Austwickia sp. TVS 96-490-7B]|uniref:ATP-binding cassette domain-containing protein n=1 Tax=Austwickia sp. TVS 96-490-7B TaxID=2830843 RepID=UPI00351D12BB
MMSIGLRADPFRLLFLGALSVLRAISDVAIAWLLVHRLWEVDLTSLTSIASFSMLLAASLSIGMCTGLFMSWVDSGFRVRVRSQLEESAAWQMGGFARTTLLEPHLRENTEILRNGSTQLGMFYSDLVRLTGAVVRLLGLATILGTTGSGSLIIFICCLLPIGAARLGASAKSRCLKKSRRWDNVRQCALSLFSSASGLRDLKLYDRQQEYAEKFSYSDARARAWKVRGEAVSAALEAIGWLMFLVLSWLLILAGQGGSLETVGASVALLQLMGACTACIRVIASMEGWLGACSELVWVHHWIARQEGCLVGGEPEDSARECASIAGEPDLTLVFDHVSYRYDGACETALHDLSVTFTSPCVVAVVGENGSGKSTFVKLAMGLVAPSQGRVYVSVGGEHQDPAATRGLRTAVFQDFLRPKLSIREVVGMGGLRAGTLPPDVCIHESIAAAGLADDVSSIGGLDVLLGPGGRGMSFGQWQRLAIARASMRRKAPLSMLDEPGSALDPAGEEALYARLRTSGSGYSVGGVTLLVTHRLAATRYADIVCVFEAGHLVEMGSPAELMARPGGFLRQQFDVQGEEGE